MQIKLSEEQINMILDYDRTRSVTSACNLALSLANQVLEEYAKEME